MIPKIDLNVFEWRMVRDFADKRWQKEKVFAVFSDNQQCWATYKESLSVGGTPYTWNFYRPIEKKTLPLESAFDIPSWCFGRTFNSDISTLVGIFDKKTVLSLAGETYSLDWLAKTTQYITRDGFGRFNLYREVEE